LKQWIVASQGALPEAFSVNEKSSLSQGNEASPGLASSGGGS
jgi:hypothetical protein